MHKMMDDRDSKLAQEKKQNSERQLKIQKDSEELQKKKNAENFSKTFKLQSELSLLVKARKIEVAKITADMEQLRSDKDTTINNQL